MYIFPFVEKYFIPSLPSRGILLFIIQDKFHISKRPGNILYVPNVNSGKKKEFVRRPFFVLCSPTFLFLIMPCLSIWSCLSRSYIVRKTLMPLVCVLIACPKQGICPKQGQDFEPSAANGYITHPSDLL